MNDNRALDWIAAIGCLAIIASAALVGPMLGQTLLNLVGM